MANLRFYRRFKIFPNLPIPVSRTGPSLVVGLCGHHLTFSRRHIVQRLPILPGSGIYFVSKVGTYSGFHSAHFERPTDEASERFANLLGAIATISAILMSAFLVLALLSWMI